MTVIAYDSIDPKFIPGLPMAIFPYAGGKHGWLHTYFPHALYRYITDTTPGEPAIDIADWEPGALWGKGNLTKWADERLAINPHHDLTVYTDEANYELAVNEMEGLTWHLFLAKWGNGGAAAPPELAFDGRHVRAHQFQNRPGYDRSFVFDVDWLNKP